MRRSTLAQTEVLVSNTSEKTPKNTVRQKKKTVSGVCFLLLIIVVLGGIIKHYSKYESGASFVLLTEKADSLSSTEFEIDCQRLLVRNRYPFVLALTVRLCKVENDAQQPEYAVLTKSQYTFSGKRSWYSGTYQTAFTVAASNEGRFLMTDFPLSQENLMNDFFADKNLPDEEKFFPSENLPKEAGASLIKAIKEGNLSRLSEISEDRKIRNGQDNHWFCALPGGNADKVLVITLTPLANYE